jgi:hypothetical protein
VGRPRFARAKRCAFNLADRDHLARVILTEEATARASAKRADVRQILKLARSQLARRYPRDFTFYVADPISSIRVGAYAGRASSRRRHAS